MPHLFPLHHFSADGEVHLWLSARPQARDQRLVPPGHVPRRQGRSFPVPVCELERKNAARRSAGQLAVHPINLSTGGPFSRIVMRRAVLRQFSQNDRIVDTRRKLQASCSPVAGTTAISLRPRLAATRRPFHASGRMIQCLRFCPGFDGR